MNRLSIYSAELISDLRQYSDRLWCDVRKVELTEANAYSAVRKFTDSDLNTGSDSVVRKFPDRDLNTGSDSAET